MASPTWWTWVWINSGSWWWTGRPSVLRFMGSQRVRHDWVTELNWTEVHFNNHCVCNFFPILLLCIFVLFLFKNCGIKELDFFIKTAVFISYLLVNWNKYYLRHNSFKLWNKLHLYINNCLPTSFNKNTFFDQLPVAV